MTDFEKKLPLYKTAYSPLYEAFVGIKKVRQDESGRFLIQASVAGTGGKEVLFAPEELTDYCL